jgi:hypothetical protein
VSVADVGFILAVGALGWGLSLVTYRALATRQGWPMGTWHTRAPQLPIAIGAVCMVLAVWAATRRIGSDDGTSGWLILLFGLAWAVFWTGFLRVGAQSALLLAPVAALLLLLRGLA